MFMLIFIYIINIYIYIHTTCMCIYVCVYIYIFLSLSLALSLSVPPNVARSTLPFRSLCWMQQRESEAELFDLTMRRERVDPLRPAPWQRQYAKLGFSCGRGLKVGGVDSNTKKKLL